MGATSKIIDMKKFYILLIALFMTSGACQRSQFSTTTRHKKNGKVTYVNNYSKEGSKISNNKSHKNKLNKSLIPQESTSDDRTVVQNLPEPEIQKIAPVSFSNNKNLLLSTSNEPAIISVNENRNVGNNELLLSKSIHYQASNTGCYADTNKMIAPKRGTTMDLSVQQVIRLKNGHKILAGIIYQSNDTLFYQSSSNPDVTKIVKVEEVDTIIKVKYIDSTTGKVVDMRKTESLGIVGFIFSILGIIPIFGLPFGILAVLFGALSLKKINRHPERYKGRGVANASLIIGILGVAISAIVLIAVAISGGIGTPQGMGG